MEEYIIVIAIFILLFTMGHKSFVESFDKSNWVREKAWDGNDYLVRPSKQQRDVADCLATLNASILKIIEELKNRKQNNELGADMIVPLENLLKRYSHNAIREGMEENEYTSFSLDKREIHFCVRSRDDKHSIYDSNLLLYVGIHEVSHLACPNEGHTREFTSIFVYLLGVASDLHLYEPMDFRKSPVNYCGLILNKS